MLKTSRLLDPSGPQMEKDAEQGEFPQEIIRDAPESFFQRSATFVLVGLHCNIINLLLMTIELL